MKHPILFFIELVLALVVSLILPIVIGVPLVFLVIVVGLLGIHSKEKEPEEIDTVQP